MSLEITENKPDTEENHNQLADGTLLDTELNPFSYTNTDHFTSENFKIEISPLPKFLGYSQLTKRLNSLDLKPVKVKVIKNSGFAFVTFRNEEDRMKAIDTLNGHQWKGIKFSAKPAKPMADPLLKKRKIDQADESSTKIMKKSCQELKLSDLNSEQLADRIKDTVIPLRHLSYEEQLKQKQESMIELLKKLAAQIDKNNPDLKFYHKKQRKANRFQLFTELEDIRPSPVVNHYRNKVEFTIGSGPNNEGNQVGFRLGSYKAGDLSVVSTTGYLHVSQQMEKAALSCEKFLCNISKQTHFNQIDKSGFWRMIRMRSNQAGDLMIVYAVCSSQFTQEVVDEEVKKLVEYHKLCENNNEHVASLFLLELKSDSAAGEGDYRHLLGETHIYENLLGMKFRISPSSFFQVNTRSAEVLYSLVGDWCCLTPDTVLLDVCCGTGTIGITLAKKAHKVIGLEVCSEAIEDARKNAQLNELNNVDFILGKAEDTLPSVLLKSTDKDIVAVVDPPRAGLHKKVVSALRKADRVTRLIYVSCNPAAAIQNIVDLTREQSKRMQGVPFKVTKAAPVDLFPHTKSCELVLLMERLEEKFR